MKRLSLLGFALLGVVALIGIWFHVRRVGPENLDSGHVVEQGSAKAPTSRSAVSREITDKQENSLVARPDSVDTSLWEKMTKQYSKLLSMNGPVEFYGRCLDQEGNPVPSVKVEASLEAISTTFLKDWAAATERKKIEPARIESLVADTDADGRFSFTKQQGITLRILALSREGYRAEPMEVSTFSFGEFANKRSPNLFRNPQTPVVFRLLKKGPTEPMISWKKTAHFLAGDPGYRPFNLLSGPVVGVVDGVPELSLQVVADPLADPNQPHDFSLLIRVNGGGIQETTNVFLLQAPEAGYQTSVEHVMSPNDTTVKLGTWKRRYYVIARGGKMYGAITMSYHGYFTIEARVNPHGSRNLEFDPDKQITDPEIIRRLDAQTRP